MPLVISTPAEVEQHLLQLDNRRATKTRFGLASWHSLFRSIFCFLFFSARRFYYAGFSKEGHSSGGRDKNVQPTGIFDSKCRNRRRFAKWNAITRISRSPNDHLGCRIKSGKPQATCGSYGRDNSPERPNALSISNWRS